MKSSIPLNWRRIPERYNITGTKCHTCGQAYFPIRGVCPTCRRKGKLENILFSGKGKVYSFTEISVPPEGFESQTPYLLAIIELEEGARLTAQIVDAKLDQITIGTQVEPVFRMIQKDDPEGLIHYGFKFRIVK